MQLNVYYLDDEESLCENFVDYFGSSDICVSTFTDPTKAIETIKQSPPDVMFVDFRLPGTTGDKVAEAIDPKIPKFLISGDISVQTTYTFIKIFSKPYNESDISKILQEYLLEKIGRRGGI